MKKNLNPLLLESEDAMVVGGLAGSIVGSTTPYAITKLYHKLVTQPRIRKEVSEMLCRMTIKELNSELQDLIKFFNRCLKYNFSTETKQWLKKVIKYTTKILVSKEREIKIQYIYHVAIKWGIPSKSCKYLMSNYDGRLNSANRFLLFISSVLSGVAGGAVGSAIGNNM